MALSENTSVRLSLGRLLALLGAALTLAGGAVGGREVVLADVKSAVHEAEARSCSREDLQKVRAELVERLARIEALLEPRPKQ
jgi:hypothetical protein